MTTNYDYHCRKSIRLSGYDYSASSPLSNPSPMKMGEGSGVRADVCLAEKHFYNEEKDLKEHDL